MNVTTAMLLNWLRNSACIIRTHRDMLTDLDAAIGDGDHGINLDRGFQAVSKCLEAKSNDDAGTILKATGMRLIATVGGASGPLYGTAFRRAGKVVEGQMALMPTDMLEAYRAFVESVIVIGKVAPAQKTMLDALMPALETLEHGLDDGMDLPIAMNEAALAAAAGAEATIPLIARRGRASYLGERSIGHQDPGATSSALILRALADTLLEET